MAKLDWEAKRTALEAVTVTNAQNEVKTIIIANLELYGVPYNGAYTTTVDIEKTSSFSAYSLLVGLWTTQTSVSHDQAVEAINYAEAYLAGAVGSVNPALELPFDSSYDGRQAAVAIFTSRFNAIRGTASNAGLEGMVEFGTDYKQVILDAYASYPTRTLKPDYDSTKSVPVPGVGSLTVAQVEEKLQALMDEADLFIDELTWP